MAVAVSFSGTEVVLDTLPAYKVRHFHGHPRAGKLYCYARLYASPAGLSASLSAFEEHPAEDSRAGLLLSGAAGALYVGLSPKGALLYKPNPLYPVLCPQVFDAGAGSQTLPAEKFAGVDEQGWFWGANFTLPPEILQATGIGLAEGTEFYMAVYKYHLGEEAFGASHRVPEGLGLLHPGAMDTCKLTRV